ncbi:MAG: hypothetical protein ACREI9_10025 [Nitrospiraceae bacterium]
MRTIPDAVAAEKIVGKLTVKDTLTLSGQPARIEATLVRTGLLGMAQGLGGEQLELLIGGKSVAHAMTGGDGRAFLEYTPKVRGNHEVTVTLMPNPRVTSPEAKATLGAWERRRPILLVDVAAVMQPAQASPLPLPSAPIQLSERADPEPAPDAADELKRLAQFFYNVIYLSWSPKEAASLLGDTTDMREWLARHKFPSGLLMTVRPGEQVLGAKIDQLRADGWTNVKAGIGKSRAFADVLAAHRVDVVIVPVPDKGELPKKAKAVKEWKEIRKKL